MTHQYKKLSEDELNLVRELESRTGIWVVAYESQTEVAEIDGDQLQKLQALERQLGAVLVAYEKTPGKTDMKPARRSGETAKGVALLRSR